MGVDVCSVLFVEFILLRCEPHQAIFVDVYLIVEIVYYSERIEAGNDHINSQIVLMSFDKMRFGYVLADQIVFRSIDTTFLGLYLIIPVHQINAFASGCVNWLHNPEFCQDFIF